jgi:hypothetical protein
MNGTDKVELQAGDRVVVAVAADGSDATEARKARVVDVVDGLVLVTFAKGETPRTFARAQVFALYRYAEGPFGKGIVPLFFEKNA